MVVTLIHFSYYLNRFGIDARLDISPAYMSISHDRHHWRGLTSQSGLNRGTFIEGTMDRNANTCSQRLKRVREKSVTPILICWFVLDTAKKERHDNGKNEKPVVESS